MPVTATLTTPEPVEPLVTITLTENEAACLRTTLRRVRVEGWFPGSRVATGGSHYDKFGHGVVIDRMMTALMDIPDFNWQRDILHGHKAV